MVKPSKTRLKQIYDAPAHRRSRSIGATLSPDLRAQYGIRSIRVKQGDGVKVMRGEYKGIEGKVNKVHAEEYGVAIEGIQREKARGGNVPVLVHPSKVMVVSLNLDDKWRQAMLERKKKGE
ncbi:MAG: 50S ribosomal protein L24 [Nitrososphaerales archaeon]